MKRLLAAAALACALAWAQAPAPGPEASRRQRRAERAPARLPPDRADLSYGPHANNKLDLWLAKSSAPAPLVVFIHGGGFVGGDKGTVNPTIVRRCLEAGVSFAAINYRFRTEVPIQTVLRDSARAIQFLRSRAAEFRLDKTRVAAMGGSAGAGTSLWLAFHPDLADPANPDPVLRESSRLVAAAATGTQATYDLFRWKEFLGEAAGRAGGESDAPAFYGFKTIEELQGPAGARVRADVDMLGLITSDDPPVFMVSSAQHEKLDSRGAVLHSPAHARAVKKRCDEVGVPAEVRVVDGQAQGGREADHVGFLLRHLGVTEKP